MTSAGAEQGADTRNLHWRQNNKGSALLQKLGWKEGQALGSKHRRAQEQDGVEEVSGEGLKVVKRKEGLGLGASALPAATQSTSHDTFCALLKNLKKEHSATGSQRSSSKKRKKKSSSISSSTLSDDNGTTVEEKPKKKSKKKSKKKKETVFASNRITNGRVRQSKFAQKSEADMACIFGKDFSSAEIADQTHQTRKEKKKKKEADDEEAERKIKRKEEKRRKKAERDDKA
ncbi:expressed unknown protein [Seminavis robusta]|uniref:G-patch domain-containing protein n=1 Tax=Seminavis robusta TaxID=568900 RepID=A0A9N8DSJ9_9STRA|nr:expressed unknown protein [Seminavis robusta]|eukprot:Sro322_g116990.1 n/a (231) ;mRNA; f:26419-27111